MRRRFAGTVTRIDRVGRRFYARRDGDGLLVQFLRRRGAGHSAAIVSPSPSVTSFRASSPTGTALSSTVRPYRPAPAGSSHCVRRTHVGAPQ